LSLKSEVTTIFDRKNTKKKKKKQKKTENNKKQIASTITTRTCAIPDCKNNLTTTRQKLDNGAQNPDGVTSQNTPKPQKETCIT